jgi:hypothetical protein
MSEKLQCVDLKKYQHVKDRFKQVLEEMQEAGKFDISLEDELKNIMAEVEKEGLIDKKYNLISRWESLGCINNLFKIGV